MMKIKPVRVDHTRDNVADALQRTGDAVDCLIAAHNAQVDAEAKIVGSTNGTNPEHPVHPWYGPCDAFDHGQCMECRKTMTDIRTRVSNIEFEARLAAAKKVEPPERILPSGEELSVSYFKENGSVSLRTAHVQLATVEAVCQWLYDKLSFAAVEGGIIERLRTDARRVVEEAKR